MLNDPRQPNREPIIIKRADMENSGWRKLADAIIVQTANDYRRLQRRLARQPNDHNLKSNQTSIERFFRSDWFNILCDLDGTECIRKLKRPTQRMEGVQ